MIIDIPYIKTILNTEIENDKIENLINHYFDYICKYANIQTTLEKEQISLTNLTPEIDDPKIPNKELTLFQETLIFAIICNLSNLGISIQPITQNIYDHYITFFDTIEEITYCNIFTNCLNRLKNNSNDIISPIYIKRLLNLSDTDATDEEIEFLIKHYTEYLKATIPKADPESPLFKQAVILSVACHLYKTKPSIITTPNKYKVDEVEESFANLNFNKYGDTWCDLADEAIADLKNQVYGYYGLKTYDRPGARTKYGAYGPSGDTI